MLIRRNKNCRGQRGSTIYELVIVMILTAVICALVLSFSAFLTNYIDTAETLNSSLTEVSTARSAIERWFSAFDNENYMLSVKRSETDYVKTFGVEVYTIAVADGTGKEYSAEMYSDAEGEAHILLQYPQPGEDVIVPCDTIDLINFEKLGENTFYRCEISYGANVLRFLLIGRTGDVQP